MVTQGRLRPPNVCADFFLHRVFVADEDLLFILPMISVSSGKTKQNKKAAKIKWCKVPSIPLRWLQSKKQLWELSRTAPLASHQRRNWQRSCREALGCVPPACRAPPGQRTERWCRPGQTLALDQRSAGRLVGCHTRTISAEQMLQRCAGNPSLQSARCVSTENMRSLNRDCLLCTYTDTGKLPDMLGRQHQNYRQDLWPVFLLF